MLWIREHPYYYIVMESTPPWCIEKYGMQFIKDKLEIMELIVPSNEYRKACEQLKKGSTP